MAERTLAPIGLTTGDKILLVHSRKDAAAGRVRWSIPKEKYTEDVDRSLFDAARELKEEAGIALASLGPRCIDESDCVGRGMPMGRSGIRQRVRPDHARSRQDAIGIRPVGREAN
ncbi:hypothetical protein [Singulisphaera sp. PoT]|uniref:hypothetical protein n=1 Tax=Singulisphaera sp. PoT TaxID=3411797 RepID=UPI003BF52506